MTIGRLEIFRNKVWEFGQVTTFCGCYILDMGPIGITWLSNGCIHNDDGPERE